MRQWFHRFYFLGLLLKGLDGFFETVGGAAFLLTSQAYLVRLIERMTAAKIARDPDDWLANTLRHAFAHLSAVTKVLAGLYLLGHGIVKVAVVAALLRRRRWAYLSAIAAMLLFLAGEFYRWLQVRSLGLLVLMSFDAVVTILIWLEYRRAWPPASPWAGSGRTVPEESAP